MLNKTIHYKFFLYALRTALLLIASFFTYDLLKMIEIEWNKKNPNNELLHFSRRKLFHFIIIFIIDLLILYAIALTLNINL